MKKLFTMLVCAFMIFSVGGCSNNKVSEKEKKDLEVVDSGYFVTSGNEPYIEYGIIIKNPNDEYSVEFPAFTITMYDKDGKVLGTEEQVLKSIGPGETSAFGSQANPNGEKPVKVEFKMKKDADKYSKATKEDNPFKVSNTNDIIDEYGGLTCTGEIENTSDTDFDSIAVSLILYKNDKIVYGTTTYADYVTAKSKIPFEVSSLGSEVPEYDTFKIFVQQW